MDNKPLGVIAPINASGESQGPDFQGAICRALTSLSCSVQRIEEKMDQLTRTFSDNFADRLPLQCRSSHKLATPQTTTTSDSKPTVSAKARLERHIFPMYADSLPMYSSRPLRSLSASARPALQKDWFPASPKRNMNLDVDQTVDTRWALEIPEEMLSSEIPAHVVTWTPEEELDVYAHFLGDWVDKSEAFYGGSTIRICEQSWYPVNPPLVAHWSAKFTLGECSSSAWELLETRANGSTRRFVMKRSLDHSDPDACVVNYAESGLSFILRRKKTMLTKILTSSNRAHQVRVAAHSQRAIVASRLKNIITRIVGSATFEFVASSVIFANAVIVGIETQAKLSGHDVSSTSAVTDLVFLVIFICEFVLRLVANPSMEKQRAWFCFDALCIAAGVFGTAASGFASARRFFVLRAFRLLRLARVLRVSNMFGAGWRLLCGCIGTSSTIFSTLALMVVILYIFACIGIELVTNNENLTKNRDLIERKFSGIFMTMLTLLQFTTEDSIAAIYVPLVREEPLLALYFLPIIFIFTISLMNMVTAIIVEGAFRAVQSDRDNRQIEQACMMEHLAPIYMNFFDALDRKGVGYIKYSDIEHFESSLVPEELHRHFHMETLEELFDIVDGGIDGGSTASITKQSFVDVLLTLRLAEIDRTPTELILVLKLVRRQTPMLRSLLANLNLIATELFEIQHYLESQSPVMGSKGSASGKKQTTSFAETSRGEASDIEDTVDAI